MRIVDLSVALTGPLAAGMLVDQGADCVKVEQAPPATFRGRENG